MSGIHTVLLAGILCAALTPAVAQDNQADRFTDHGIPVPLAECRGVYPVQDANGNSLVMATSLDLSPRGWIVVTDVDTGTTEQVLCPEGVPNSPPYGSLVGSNGRLYTSQGSIFLEFDPTSRQWTFQQPLGCIMLTVAEDPDGLIWIGGVHGPKLISFNPDTRELRDYGPMDDNERYLQYLGFDDKGWVYCGIGTARVNLVAYHPQTGERRQLVPEDRRQPEVGRVWRGADGNLYGTAGLQGGTEHYRLDDGRATLVEQAQLPARAEPRNPRPQLPDGRTVSAYDFHAKYMEIYDPATLTTKRIEFSYDTDGARIGAMTAGPDGKLYANSGHPSYFIYHDPATGELSYFPDRQGHTSLARQGNYVFGGEYTGGALWVFDTTRPWNKVPRRPEIIGGMSAAELLQVASTEDGQLVHNAARDSLMFRATDWGGQLDIKLNAAEDSHYNLLVATEAISGWLDVNFLIDGEMVSRRHRIAHTGAEHFGSGPIFTVALADLKAGEHTLSIQTDKGDVPEILVMLKAVLLTQQPPEAVLTQPAEPNPLKAIDNSRPDVNVPRVSFPHPDGTHVMIAGAPGYGRVGGGLSIYNLETAETIKLTHEDLVPYHTITSIDALPNGNLICGTTVSGTHGGAAVDTAAVIYELDWPTKTVSWKTVPMPAITAISQVKLGAEGRLHCVARQGEDTVVFALDLQSKQVVQQQSLPGEYGGGGKLMDMPDGQVYMLMTNAILRLNMDTYDSEKVTDSPTPIGVSTLLGERIYFASGSRLWSYRF